MRINKCIFISSLFVAFSIALFGSSYASAASIFDDTIVVTDTVSLRTTPSTVDDVTLDFIDKWQSAAQITCTSGDFDSFIDTVTNGGHYAIVQLPDMGDGSPFPYYRIVWDTNYTNPTSTLNFANIGGKYISTSSGQRIANINYGPAWGTYGATCSTGASRVSTDPTDFTTSGNVYQVYVSTYPITYPAGYEGQFIPETREEPTAALGLLPAFSYEIENLDITLQDITTTNMIGDRNIDSCYFMIGTVKETFDCTTKPAVTHTFSATGSYNIKLVYVDDENKKYVQQRVFVIDGGDYTGTVGNPEYNEVISDVLEGLVVGDYGLQQFLLAPINFFATFPAIYSENCTPIEYELMGQNMELDCNRIWSQSFMGTLYFIWTTSLVALTSYAAAVGIFRTIKNVNTPHKDSIDVGHL